MTTAPEALMATTRTNARSDELVVATVERQAWLDGLAGPLQQAIEGAVSQAGRPGEGLMSFLRGKWLGHPLHPALTDVPIGAWTATVALDILDGGDRRGHYRRGADTTLAVGVVGAVGAAVTGIADWSQTAGITRRLGMAHALLNSAALLLMSGSMVARRSGLRPQGRALAGLGYGVALASAYLGGHLVFRRGMGVDASPEDRGPSAAGREGGSLGTLPTGQVVVRWTPDELLAVLAALDEGAQPRLESEIEAKIRNAAEQRVVIEDADVVSVDLTRPEGQLLKRWCDERRAHAQEEDPHARWTRVVAKVNEAVQWAAPAKD
jgi:uncharacterized membrane protein